MVTNKVPLKSMNQNCRAILLAKESKYQDKLHNIDPVSQSRSFFDSCVYIYSKIFKILISIALKEDPRCLGSWGNYNLFGVVLEWILYTKILIKQRYITNKSIFTNEPTATYGLQTSQKPLTWLWLGLLITNW